MLCSNACRASAVQLGQSSFTRVDPTWLRTVRTAVSSAPGIRPFEPA